MDDLPPGNYTSSCHVFTVCNSLDACLLSYTSSKGCSNTAEITRRFCHNGTRDRPFIYNSNGRTPGRRGKIVPEGYKMVDISNPYVRT
jgi:hypothetical protein